MEAAMNTQATANDKRTYTVKEISTMLGISENACYAFVKEMKDEFRSVRIGTSITTSIRISGTSKYQH